MFRVLLVDDEAPFVENMLAFDWAKNNCECVGVAYNGEEALRLAGMMFPHIIITDVHMPRMDGIELINILREKYPEIQVILLTAYSVFSYAQAALRVNAVDYVVKDSSFEQNLSGALQKACATFDQDAGYFLREQLMIRAKKILRLDTMGRGHSRGTAFDKKLREYVDAHAGKCILAVSLPVHPNETEWFLGQLDRLQDPPDALFYDGSLVELFLGDNCHDVEKWYNDMHDTWLPINLAISAAMSGPISCFDSYAEHHQKCMDTLNHAFFTGNRGLVHAQSCTSDRVLPKGFFEEHFRKLELMGGNRQEFEAYLSETLQPALKRYEPDSALVRDTIDMWLRRYEMKYAYAPMTAAREAIALSGSLGEALNVFKNAISQLLPTEDSISYVLSEAVKYMTEHLNEPELSLGDVAKHVSMSSGYLSKRFSDETGKSYQQVLTKLRMEKAVQLLSEKRMLVYEVAEQCGYTNYRSFAKAVANYYGKKPKSFQ